MTNRGFHIRVRGTIRKVTDRDVEVLLALLDAGWTTPLRIGGSSRSHHSATLAKLVRHGLVLRKRRSTGVRGSWLYRISPRGRACV